MGQKVHPLGFRLGFVKTWNAKWYAGSKNYPILLKEDVSIRSGIRARLRDAAISRIDIERSTNQVTVTIHTAKPGVVIGKGGAKVEELRQVLGKTTGKAVKVNIFEIRYPELDAVLIALFLTATLATARGGAELGADISPPDHKTSMSWMERGGASARCARPGKPLAASSAFVRVSA